MSTKPDPRIDAYIAKSAEFARPILTHLRQLVHEGCPEAEETIKWGMPFFTHHGILCMMAAFKAHCAFGFWHRGMKAVISQEGGKAEEAMGNVGRITSLADLPSDRDMLRYIRHAAELNASGVPARAKKATKPKALTVPADLGAALKKNKAAAATFEKFSHTNRKDYIEWITEAKREETRAKRLATTVEWLAEGKTRNWKYADC
jgi:uncharacterized protein YdeI (YjbR/CyaY-like superfamily)